MSDTTRAGTLRAPRSPAEYFEAKRANEWVKRGDLREFLAAIAAEYRALFEKEQQERAKALAALQQDLVRAHERILNLRLELDWHLDHRWEYRLQLRWAGVKLAVRRWFAPRAVERGVTIPHLDAALRLGHSRLGSRADRLALAAKMLDAHQEAERLGTEIRERLDQVEGARPLYPTPRAGEEFGD